METKLVKMGNSRGVRIPKLLLEEAGFVEKVEIARKGKSIIITPCRTPRKNWADDAAEIVALGQDELLIPDVFDDETLDEWGWPSDSKGEEEKS